MKCHCDVQHNYKKPTLDVHAHLHPPWRCLVSASIGSSKEIAGLNKKKKNIIMTMMMT